ncbi:hypothetical protein KPH14_004763 [Odynerus spinipes]|uniref:Uncharacterized protein n=1 Tax=Odynerus spinipes TaxID=1348599 RepID=A0AAD9RMG4_9HYME|nr:hypothetical protein KPH14_004763 [Odynerus spinipes]
MQQLQQVSMKQNDRMVIHAPDISTNFILNTAVRDATNILLKPYLTSSLPLSCHPNIRIYAKDCELMSSRQEPIGKSQYFLTRMAAIAWDFLNISSIFHCNVNQTKMKSDF